MPINKPLPPALPFTVDVWEPTGAAKPQFLTHAHKDHTAGIVEGARHIVCNPTTLDLVRIKFPGLAERLDAGAVQHTPLEPWETLHLAAPPGAGGSFRAAGRRGRCPKGCAHLRSNEGSTSPTSL